MPDNIELLGTEYMSDMVDLLLFDDSRRRKIAQEAARNRPSVPPPVKGRRR